MPIYGTYGIDGLEAGSSAWVDRQVDALKCVSASLIG